MPHHSFESSLSSPAPTVVEHGPLLECAPVGADAAPTLRIRARRAYGCSEEELFRAWTARSAWERWMRLRARSRASMGPYPGGAFRLELAEGPTIHVVTGVVLKLQAPNHLRLSWQHLEGAGGASTVDVTIRHRLDWTELVLTHGDIGSRRDAAWLMRLWTIVLGRLGDHIAAQGSQSALLRRRMFRLVATEGAVQRPSSRV